MGMLFTQKGNFSIPENEQEILKGRLQLFEDNRIRKTESFRSYRNQLLQETDWIVIKSTESNVGISSDWTTYRQSLRDLPQHERSPDRFLISDWPLSPTQTEIPEEAKIFIAEISDPLGIGTTSWIFQREDGTYYLDENPQPVVPPIIIEEEIPVDETPVEEPVIEETPVEEPNLE